MTTATPVRRVAATVLGPSRLLVDHGFGVFLARDVLFDPPLATELAIGTPVLLETTRPSRRFTKGRLVGKSVPTYDYPARVGRVVDGDTVWLDVDVWAGFPDCVRILVRVDGVNCPESHGPTASDAGRAAAAFTTGLLPVGALVTVTTRRVEARLLGHGEKVEVHGRYLAAIALPAAGGSSGRDLAATLIAAGHAVEYHGERRVVP